MLILIKVCEVTDVVLKKHRISPSVSLLKCLHLRYDFSRDTPRYFSQDVLFYIGVLVVDMLIWSNA